MSCSAVSHLAKYFAHKMKLHLPINDVHGCDLFLFFQIITCIHAWFACSSLKTTAV